MKNNLIFYFLILSSIISTAQNKSFWDQNKEIRRRVLLNDLNLKGNLKSIKSFRFETYVDSKINCVIQEIELNQNGQMIQNKFPGLDFNILEKYFYSNNRLDSIVGNPIVIYNYDKSNKWIGSSYKDINRKFAFNKTTNIYNKEGYISEILETGNDKTIYTYDNLGNLNSKKYVREGGNVTYNYTKDADGTERETKIDDRDLTNSSIMTYKYNANKNLETFIVTQGKDKRTAKFEYFYDNYGNCLRQIETVNGKIFSKTYYQNTYFDKDKNGDFIITKDEIIPSKSDLEKKPNAIIKDFFEDLNKKDFAKAYSYCHGNRWGTLQQFASTKMYGGITSVKINKIEELSDTNVTTVTLETNTELQDDVNGNGTFVQKITLEKKQFDLWKITAVKLISSDRPQDNWNLKMPAQPDFTIADAEKFTNPIYKKIGNEPTSADSPQDTLSRAIPSIEFLKTDKALFAIAVCENRAPFYGASIGWCDIFIFKKEKNKWNLTEQMLEAGGGGMYGSPGEFAGLIRVADNAVGIVLSGGQTHMGALFHNDIIQFKEGKLEKMTSIFTHHSYEFGDGNTICEDNSYYFEKNGKNEYDLKIKKTDCLEKNSKKSKKPIEAVIPYINGYNIPKEFQF